MRKIRVGNDFTVEWSIFGEKDGTRWAYDLSGKDITLKLVSPVNTMTIKDFIISDNTIIWKCYGKDQKNVGCYGLVLIENNGELGMVTIDEVSAFMLVSHTEDEDSGGGCPTLSVDHIEFSTQIEMERNSEGSSDIVVDSLLSLTSENPVQNKVITEELNNKVNKVSGKQLSTEDFTTELKTKLEGMNSFDPTEINNKVNGLQTQIDTLVSGDTSTAIESFNEITNFLNGIEDTKSLEGIIAGIEQQITNKQDTIADLDAIRSGAALGATAIQSVKTINGQSVEGEGNITIEGGGSNITVDSELSDTSENPLQNKVVKSTFDGFAQEVIRLHEEQGAGMQEMSINLYTELLKKVDKVDGKQLSTEDFTTALKTKLEGLNEFDPTDINNAITGLQNQLNTLVSGDVSTAIESFNEIIAFLNGVEDSESLDSIITAIEQQIAGKQNKLVSGTNIKTINGESILGEGNITIKGGGVSEEYVNNAIASAITNTLNTAV